MRFVEEFRDPDASRRLADAIAARATRRFRVMEVCGGQTHAILAHGIDVLVAPAIELLHGPGCPVCVTPVETLDHALRIATEGGLEVIMGVCIRATDIRLQREERE